MTNQPNYPHQDGDVTVLGPEIFASQDGKVICWKGETYVPQQRLRLAHQARRAKEHQLDDIRRALCDAGLMQDDDPYSHADLADVIRQTAPAELTDAREQLRLIDGMRQQNLDSAAAAIQRAEHAEAAIARLRALQQPFVMWRDIAAALDEPGPAEPTACDAYQPPTTPADSGLCARCGMYDYKHQEVSGA